MGDELISAWSAVGFQRQIERFEIQSGEVLDVVDATGDVLVISFRSDDRATTHSQEEVDEVRRHPALNESENARRIGVAYPETSLSGKSVSRIITDVAALAAQGTPNKPFQRTRVDGARPVAERKR